MVKFGCVLETRKGDLMHFPEEGRGLQGDQPHRLQPTGPGCFQMEAVFRQFPNIRKDGKLITPGMNGEFVVPIILGDEGMLGELFPEDPQVATVIDPLLEFPDETGGEGIDPDPFLVQLDNEEEMVLGRGGKGCLVDRDFKIDGRPVSLSRTDEFIEFFD